MTTTTGRPRKFKEESRQLNLRVPKKLYEQIKRQFLNILKEYER